MCPTWILCGTSSYNLWWVTRGSEFRTQVCHQDVNILEQVQTKAFILMVVLLLPSFTYALWESSIWQAIDCMCDLFKTGNAMLSGAEAHLPWSGVRFQTTWKTWMIRKDYISAGCLVIPNSDHFTGYLLFWRNWIPKCECSSVQCFDLSNCHFFFGGWW